MRDVVRWTHNEKDRRKYKNFNLLKKTAPSYGFFGRRCRACTNPVIIPVLSHARTMQDSQRAASARSNGGSRRRRWEVKSKEAFETSLAVEIESPEKRSQHARKNSKSEQFSESPKNKNNFNHTYREFPKASSQKNKEWKDPNDTDLLSSRLSALINEANTKYKDPQRRLNKEKTEDHSRKEDFESNLDIKKDEEHISNIKDARPYKENNTDDYTIDQSQMKPLKETDKTQKLNDKFETKSLQVVPSPEMKNVCEQTNFKASAPPLSPSEKETPKKKKRHKKKTESKLLMVSNSNEESYISLQLKEMDDDVIEVSREDKDCVLSAPKLLLAASASNPHSNISTIYQEKLGGFVVARNEFDGVQKKSEDMHDVSQVPTRSSHAIFLQGGFRTFSVFCQGLLAGITLAHCLLIFLLNDDPNKIAGLYPSSMAHVFFTLVIFLTTICLVAACDRSDLIGLGIFSGHGIKVPWTTAFYISSLVLSLVAIRTENVLINFSIYQGSGFSEQELTDLVDWWRWICVARSSLAVLAWLAVVPDPHTDALLDFIQDFHNK